MNAKELRTHRERVLFGISAAISAIAWIVICVSVIGLAYSLLVAVGVLMAHALLLARVTGNGVRVSSTQLPEIWQKVQEASRKLGLAAPPEVYVVQAGGLLNAFATKLLSRRFVILYSDLLDACDLTASGEPNELDFVIGHEIGHLAAGHLAWQWFLLPSRIIPLLGPAYSRAREYTCDLCGHAATDSLEASSRALAILAAGGRAGRRVNLDAFVEQAGDTGRFWMAIYELNATHPFLSKRVAALRAAKGFATRAAARRPVLAYPLAPVLRIAAFGPGVIVLLATYAAIFASVPTLKKYFMQQQQKAAAAQFQLPPDGEPAAAPEEPAPSQR
ncbi:MAG TPA: M48 family metallopeptidase [Polyangia bacterium]|nr:M48 family metallopeptidase [Polyangia bacterium]